MPSLLILMASAALAADTTAPTWPAQAWLEVGQDEALYDHPATTEEEAERRWRQALLHLHWPSAQDDTGVSAYRILQAGQPVTTVDGQTRTWGALVDRPKEPWAVVPIDAAGNEGSPLKGILPVQPVAVGAQGLQGAHARLVMIGTRREDPGGEVMDSVLGPMSEENLAQLDALFAGAEGIAVASSITSPPAPPRNVAVRVGRRGETVALLERSFHWQADHPISWGLNVDGRDLKLVLAPEPQDDTPAWSLELHSWPQDSDSRLSRQVMLDPLSDSSLGGCERETDYERTGDLWVEWGVAPRGDDPHAPCEQVRALETADPQGEP